MISKIYDEQKNKMPEAELKKILLEAIGSVRYGEENDYFFVYDKNSTILKLPLLFIAFCLATFITSGIKDFFIFK